MYPPPTLLPTNVTASPPDRTGATGPPRAGGGTVNPASGRRPRGALLLGVGLLVRRRVLERERGVVLELLRPERRQFADLLRFVGCEVLGFRPVGTQVVQLPRAVLAGRDDLPVA